jgi:hypothetical protein
MDPHWADAPEMEQGLRFTAGDDFAQEGTRDRVKPMSKIFVNFIAFPPLMTNHA